MLQSSRKWISYELVRFSQILSVNLQTLLKFIPYFFTGILKIVVGNFLMEAYPYIMN